MKHQPPMANPSDRKAQTDSPPAGQAFMARHVTFWRSVHPEQIQ